MAKAQPYAEKREPAPAPKPLTAAAAADLHLLLQQTEGERKRVADKRAEMVRKVEQARVDYERFAEVMRDEVDSADTVLAELDGTADRYRQRLNSFDASQGDKLIHATAWGSPEAPQTGAFALPQGPHDAAPADGYCINCGAPAWRADVRPNGATHSFGPTCNPDDPNSLSADLRSAPAGGAAQ